MSHGIVVVYALISGLGFLAYGFIGLGKFMEIFIPWEYVNQFLQLDIPMEYIPHIYGIVFTLFAVFYTVLGGMTSIVWADVLQYTIMAIASIAIAIIAFNAVGDYGLNVPDGWLSPFFRRNTRSRLDKYYFRCEPENIGGWIYIVLSNVYDDAI